MLTLTFLVDDFKETTRMPLSLFMRSVVYFHVFMLWSRLTQESLLGAYDGVSSQVNPSTGARAATGRFAAAPTFRHE